jgi:hypothetical protein
LRKTGVNPNRMGASDGDAACVRAGGAAKAAAAQPRTARRLGTGQPNLGSSRNGGPIDAGPFLIVLEPRRGVLADQVLNGVISRNALRDPDHITPD